MAQPLLVAPMPLPLHLPPSGLVPPLPPPQEPSEGLTYAAYSPSPSSIAIHRSKMANVRDWTTFVPTKSGRRPGPSPLGAPDLGASTLSFGQGVGVGSAVWSDRSSSSESTGTVPTTIVNQALRGSSTKATTVSMGSGQQKATLPSAQAGEGQGAPRPVRSPPVPLLAQPPALPPATMPALPRGRTPPPPEAPRDLRRVTSGGTRAQREAYLASALDLPLDMLSQTQKSSSTESGLTSGRLDSLLGEARGLQPSQTTSPRQPDHGRAGIHTWPRKAARGPTENEVPLPSSAASPSRKSPVEAPRGTPRHRHHLTLPRHALSRSPSSLDRHPRVFRRTHRDPSLTNLQTRFEATAYPLPASTTPPASQYLPSPNVTVRFPREAADCQSIETPTHIPAPTRELGRVKSAPSAFRQKVRQAPMPAPLPYQLPLPPSYPASPVLPFGGVRTHSPLIAPSPVRPIASPLMPHIPPFAPSPMRLIRTPSLIETALSPPPSPSPPPPPEPDAPSSPPVSAPDEPAAAGDNEHVSFDVPQKSGGRLHVSLAWLRDSPAAADSQSVPSSPPPVPPKKPAFASCPREKQDIRPERVAPRGMMQNPVTGMWYSPGPFLSAPALPLHPPRAVPITPWSPYAPGVPLSPLSPIGLSRSPTHHLPHSASTLSPSHGPSHSSHPSDIDSEHTDSSHHSARVSSSRRGRHPHTDMRAPYFLPPPPPPSMMPRQYQGQGNWWNRMFNPGPDREIERGITNVWRGRPPAPFRRPQAAHHVHAPPSPVPPRFQAPTRRQSMWQRLLPRRSSQSQTHARSHGSHNTSSGIRAPSPPTSPPTKKSREKKGRDRVEGLGPSAHDREKAERRQARKARRDERELRARESPGREAPRSTRPEMPAAQRKVPAWVQRVADAGRPMTRGGLPTGVKRANDRVEGRRERTRTGREKSGKRSGEQRPRSGGDKGLGGFLDRIPGLRGGKAKSR